jgi:hypothetical protein
MSAVTIGRMKAGSQAATMRQYISPTVGADELSLQIRWAVMELTGESFPDPTSPMIGKAGWFLEPIRP